MDYFPLIIMLFGTAASSHEPIIEVSETQFERGSEFTVLCHDASVLLNAESLRCTSLALYRKVFGATEFSWLAQFNPNSPLQIRRLKSIPDGRAWEVDFSGDGLHSLWSTTPLEIRLEMHDGSCSDAGVYKCLGTYAGSHPETEISQFINVTVVDCGPAFYTSKETTSSSTSTTTTTTTTTSTTPTTITTTTTSTTPTTRTSTSTSTKAITTSTTGTTTRSSTNALTDAESSDLKDKILDDNKDEADDVSDNTGDRQTIHGLTIALIIACWIIAGLIVVIVVLVYRHKKLTKKKSDDYEVPITTVMTPSPRRRSLPCTPDEHDYDHLQFDMCDSMRVAQPDSRGQPSHFISNPTYSSGADGDCSCT